MHYNAFPLQFSFLLFSVYLDVLHCSINSKHFNSVYLTLPLLQYRCRNHCKYCPAVFLTKATPPFVAMFSTPCACARLQLSGCTVYTNY